MKFIIGTAIVLLYYIFNVSCEENNIELPEVPCPKIFRYLNVGTEWIGIIELENIQRGQIYILAINLGFGEYIHDSNFGKLELLYDHEKTLNNIIFSNRVSYRIKFPPSQKYIPTVRKITLNQITICEAPTESVLPITFIQLDHTLSSTYTYFVNNPINKKFIQNVRIVNKINPKNNLKLEVNKPKLVSRRYLPLV